MSETRALDRMIAAAPGALRAVAEMDIAAAVDALRGCERIALVGTGTSFHAAELGAWALNAEDGRRARAAESSRLGALDRAEGVILITHTGETAYSLRVRRRVLAARQPLVSITGPAVDWPEALVTPVREEAETYTVSYTAALAVLGRLVDALAGAGEPGPRLLGRIADRVERIVADPEIDHVGMPARSLALVGTGPWAVTAREAALKLREGARMLCEGFDAERLLHGFAVPYGPADGLVLVEPDEDPIGLTAALGAAAARESIPVFEITEPTPDTGVVFGQIPITVRLQCLAARFARLRGTDPDTAITGAWAEPALWELGAPGAAEA